MKIALGSVQFGCDYGISNQQGQVSTAELNKILVLAKHAGIKVIDTAPAYGNSEQALGEQSLASAFNFVSKIPPNCAIDEMITGFNHSLQALKSEQLSALMLHHGEQLLSHNGPAIYQKLLSVKQQGLSRKIGCSVYSAQEALAISEKYAIDIVQIPGNIFDQGIFQNGILAKLSAKNIEVHIRSLFLQGVVFLKENNLPLALKKLAPHLKTLEHYATKLSAAQPQGSNINSNTALIALVLAPFVQNQAIDKLVLGCCSAEELQQIITAYQLAKNLTFDYSDFAMTEPSIINPSLWQ